ncbi:MAG: hypothetical protein J5636_06810 [Clostridiales bacterium]|nr:hypothetical protein [Clostridiales bacterium]
MSKKRWLALAMTGAILMSMFLGGCKTSDKETKKKSKGEDKKAEEMLDDFCAYLKSGKYDKLDKLIDGKSKGLTTLKGFEDSEAKDVHTAARKRLSYSIESVTTDEKKESGEAIVVLTYFDVKDLKKKISDDATSKDIVRAIDDAKDLELEFEVDLVLDDDWLIDAGSVDQIVEELYSFMEDLNLEVEPTTETTYVKNLSEFSSSWYDDSYNQVEGYHQSTGFIRYMVILWECCYGETVTFEFEGNTGILYSGSYTVDGGDDTIFCDWYPTSKLDTGYIACTVYDASGRIISVGCINIYGDDEKIPVTSVYIYSVKMIDAEGNVVPGYHVGDTYIGTKLELGNYGQEVEIIYEFSMYNSRGSRIILNEGTIVSDGETGLIEWKDITDPLEPGNYELNLYNVNNEYIWYASFSIVEEGESFPCDTDSAEEYYSVWTYDPDSWDDLTTLYSTDTEVYFMFETYGYYNYMEFTYKVTDGSGKTIAEGTETIINNDRTDYFRIDLSEMSGGPVTITVLNPDGSQLLENSIEVK